MTLVVAWARRVGDLRELVMASDSRLSGDGVTWDGCPKLFALPRTDAVLGFAGRTIIAYPMILQVIRAIESNPAHVERRYDVAQLAGLIEDLLNALVQTREFGPFTGDDPEDDKRVTSFVLAGWSWRYQKYLLWEYKYPSETDHEGNRRPVYTRRRVRPAGGNGPLVLCAGDVADGALESFKAARRAGGKVATDPVDMEPLATLVGYIRSSQYPTVGGAPQVIKVYRHMNTEMFGVTWRQDPTSEAVRTYGGRQLLAYEKPYYEFVDPDNLIEHSRATSDVEAEARQLSVDTSE